MSSDALPRVRRYHDAIRRALLTEWDPIGVAHSPEAQDEYDGYVSTVYKLLIRRAAVGEIFDYLWWVETEHMGLVGDRQATERFAGVLYDLGCAMERDAEVV